ncbi:hypothetical protein [Polynucleobacter sphagniphilus]|uniref:Uncharacterized protein n=1 Tax=Polynucleobacter sphagniphilus TaxID=1743169 RepID=A0AA43M6N0_9BURK|nr:hypothetical protein [Polynucleobacter sphagniphilus]MDH6503116.1 hypothetical protein [Polynucleobacter sphagniphilus]MDH6512058.1 hypothetical protein [Polynucleobacter sphagniphilus]
MTLLNNFNGISLVLIMIFSYCVVLKNTSRGERSKTSFFGKLPIRKMHSRIAVAIAVRLDGG